MTTTKPRDTLVHAGADGSHNGSPSQAGRRTVAHAAGQPGAAYLPIAEHGLIGDLHTVALVGTDGTIDWFCCPRFDAPSVFGAILDTSRGGYWRIAPEGTAASRQLYLPDTNVLLTRFSGPGGVVEVADFMPVTGGQPHRSRIIRRVTAVTGTVPVLMDLQPRFGYGRARHSVTVHDSGAIFRSPQLCLSLAATVPVQARGGGVAARLRLQQGQTASFILSEAAAAGLPTPADEAEVAAQFDATLRWWRAWIARSCYRGRWREMVHRSALALKLLTYQPTGAIIAAPTMGLPEQVGGERNWDYRYTWIRDAAFSLYALLRLGFTGEAEAFMSWLADRFADAAREAGGPGPAAPLQIMYGIDGRMNLTEHTLGHLAGYRNSAPVRLGNGAATQLQLDIYGALIDSVYLFNKHKPIHHETWVGIAAIVDWVCANWDQPDDGIWETRGTPRRFTHSRLMCWVAVERGLRIARHRGLPADERRWRAARDAIYQQIMTRSWNAKRQAFTQHEDGDALDAAVLLMPLVKLVAGDDPRWLSTLDAIGAELVCSPGPGASTRPGSPSKRCSPTPTTPACTPRKSAPTAKHSATSRKPSPTWP